VLGGRAKTGAPPEAIEAARADLVAAWPPLSAETRAELAVIILSGADHAAT
jgi:hypothetical protein